MSTVELYLGDSLSVMNSLPEKSVDLVFCSPPYEAARTYGIDFNLRGQDWVDWAVERFVAGLRVSRGLVAWVIEGQTRDFRYSAAPILFAADLHRRGVHLRKPPIFHRVGIPGSGGPDWLRNDYEFIVCGTNGGKLPWSDNTAMGHPPKWAPGGEPSYRTLSGDRVNKQRKTMTELIGERGGNRRAVDGTREKMGKVKTASSGHDENGEPTETSMMLPAIANPGNVIKCIVGGGVMGDEFVHENEAPFPESLAEFFVKSFCPPGGTVLDCFSGSGTTAKVAAIHGRNAIGIDIRESQINLAERRIRAATDGNLLNPVAVRRMAT